jgi:hypothetical protein
MSRGWESKSVEEQQNQAAAPKSVEANDQAAEGRKQTQAASSSCSGKRILSERTSSPHPAVRATVALADIEEKLAELGWTIHL